MIPELPYGKELVINIKTTWGDKHYVGLTGVEVFSSTGESMTITKVGWPSTQHCHQVGWPSTERCHQVGPLVFLLYSVTKIGPPVLVHLYACFTNTPCYVPVHYHQSIIVSLRHKFYTWCKIHRDWKVLQCTVKVTMESSPLIYISVLLLIFFNTDIIWIVK